MSNQASRIAKIEQAPNAALWRACGNRIEVIAWGKRGARGKRKTWIARVTELNGASD